ncbi:MAG: circadian clock KaiB family protein [Pseudomonadota bacterium]
MYLLKLYIAHLGPKTKEKIDFFRSMLNHELGSNYQLDIVELLKSPASALTDDILVTPTVIRRCPPPIKKVVGNFLDREQLMFGLGLVKTGDSHSECQR